MFRASSAHLQEDKVVYMQHMVLSLSTRVRGGLSVHSLSDFSLTGLIREAMKNFFSSAFVEAFLIQMLTVCSLFLHNLVRNFSTDFFTETIGI